MENWTYEGQHDQSWQRLISKSTEVRRAGNAFIFSAVSNFLQISLHLSIKPSPRLLSFLNPDRRIQAPVLALEYFTKHIRIPKGETVFLPDAWRAYMHDADVKTAWEESKVNRYWREVLNVTTAARNINYPRLAKVVKAALVIPHDNADVERKASINYRVSPERSKLNEDTNNELRFMNNLVKFSDPQQMWPEKIPIAIRYSPMSGQSLLYKEKHWGREGTGKKKKRQEMAKLTEKRPAFGQVRPLWMNRKWNLDRNWLEQRSYWRRWKY